MSVGGALKLLDCERHSKPHRAQIFALRRIAATVELPLDCYRTAAANAKLTHGVSRIFYKMLDAETSALERCTKDIQQRRTQPKRFVSHQIWTT